MSAASAAFSLSVLEGFGLITLQEWLRTPAHQQWHKCLPILVGPQDGQFRGQYIFSWETENILAKSASSFIMSTPCYGKAAPE